MCSISPFFWRPVFVVVVAVVFFRVLAIIVSLAFVFLPKNTYSWPHIFYDPFLKVSTLLRLIYMIILAAVNNWPTTRLRFTHFKPKSIFYRLWKKLYFFFFFVFREYWKETLARQHRPNNKINYCFHWYNMYLINGGSKQNVKSMWLAFQTLRQIKRFFRNIYCAS